MNLSQAAGEAIVKILISSPNIESLSFYRDLGNFPLVEYLIQNNTIKDLHLGMLLFYYFVMYHLII